MSDRRKVLFLCTGNSARSQMADGLLRHIAGDRFEVASAGEPIACDMSAIPAGQRQAHLTTSRDLFSRIEEFREVSNGYEFRFASDPGLLVKLAEFVSLEKLCCPFLSFVIDVEPEGGPVWLRLTGREGVKTFIREEISGLLGNAINW